MPRGWWSWRSGFSPRLRCRPDCPSLAQVDGFHVVICGGGVAAVEGLLRLRSLIDDRVWLTLVAPNEEFVFRPIHLRRRDEDRVRDAAVAALSPRLRDEPGGRGALRAVAAGREGSRPE